MALLSSVVMALMLIVCVPAGTAGGGPTRAQVTILATTDVHGNILPVDYYSNKPDARGLACAATIIKQARKENPELLLLDSGDTIQGTPLVYYHNRRNNQPPDPMMVAMNALKYDAMAVGNHEYNFGLKVLEKARGEAHFPWLSANTYRKGTDQTAYDPYVVREVSGVRVGILGLTTPGVPDWENTENYAGLEFRETVGEARKVPGVDVLQAKLLRVLQEREFERVGGTRPVRVDLRLIAATNKDLEDAIKDGSFRRDLYYRLNVVSLEMPPLRERREDIPLLASYFAEKYSKKCKRRVTGISSEARTLLNQYDWPGNVRELENAIERAVVLGTGELILPEDLPEALLEVGSPVEVPVTKYHEAITKAKKQLILKAVEQAGGNYTEAAKLLGVHPNYLHRLIRNMDLKAALKR